MVIRMENSQKEIIQKLESAEQRLSKEIQALSNRLSHLGRYLEVRGILETKPKKAG